MRVSLPPSAVEVEAVGPAGEKIEVSTARGPRDPPGHRAGGLLPRVVAGQRKRGRPSSPRTSRAPRESDLSTAPPPVEPGKVTVSAAAVPDAHHEWTWLLALGALALVVFDVWYLTRDPRAASRVASPAVPRPRLPERRRA